MKIKYILIVLHFLISLFSFSQTEKDILKVDGGKIIFEDNKAIIEIQNVGKELTFEFYLNNEDKPKTRLSGNGICFKSLKINLIKKDLTKIVFISNNDKKEVVVKEYYFNK